MGQDTSPIYKAAIEALQTSLPASRLVSLLGQGYDAALTSPELFLREVVSFWED